MSVAGNIPKSSRTWSLLILCSLGSVGPRTWGQRAPSVPDAPWQPSTAVMKKYVPVVTHGEAELDATETYTLGQLIDIAESKNPATKEAWNHARASAAAVGIAKSDLYPTLLAFATAKNFNNPPLLYNSFVVQDIGLFATAVHLDYTLVDFGARRSEITAAQAKLVAANLSFNDAHLQLIQQVSQAYYALLNASGLRVAAEVNFSDAKALDDAAQERRNNGLATLPDLLEARAEKEKANYDLQSAIGAEKTAFGDLATVITAQPVHSFKVQGLDDLHIPDSLDQSVEDAIASAYQQRPDLLADRARVKAAQAEVAHDNAAYFPTLSFEGEGGWIRAWGQQDPFPGTYAQTRTYEAGLSLKWTIFDGLRRENRIWQAKAEEAAAKNAVHEREDQIADRVWASYEDAVTSLEQRKAAASLLTAAAESHSAAVESYKDGVRNLLDVLNAERDLARARALDVTARTRVLQTFTSLAFRTGDLLER
ncbi:TolC family protein [Granulicella sp. WH15]|nr:TolC family protein [Granulicella sp. WH15]